MFNSKKNNQIENSDKCVKKTAFIWEYTILEQKIYTLYLESQIFLSGGVSIMQTTLHIERDTQEP